MKLRYLLGCCLCYWFSPLTHADGTDTEPLKLESIKDNYVFPEPIAVKVTDTSQHLVVYGIGIQQQQGDGRWQDFMTNIDDHEPARMEFKLRKIKTLEAQTLTWEPKWIPKKFGQIKGTYRVYVIWNASENDHEKLYSAPFKISEEAPK